MSLKDAKTNFVVQVATNLFMQKSINEVTMKDIAVEAGIGEATIYRYFENKENIVLGCILSLQKQVNKNYFKLDNGSTGFEKIEIFYNSYLDVFKKNPDYFYFLREFDTFMYAQNQEILRGYEKEVDQYHIEYLNAYELGLKDGSIKKQDNIETFYYSTTHSLLELCKKLSINKALLTQDKKIEKVEEIQCLINLILKSLKTCESNASKNLRKGSMSD